MRIGWRRSTRRDEFASVRSQLVVADAEMRLTLARATTNIETRLRADHDDRAQTERALLDALGGLRVELAGRDAAFVDALERVTEAWDRIAERIEADRMERRSLAEAIGRLAEFVTSQPKAAFDSTYRVIGGTVFGDAIDVRENGAAAEPSPPRIDAEMLRLGVVEVRCRFGDRWVEGFEVSEIVEDDGVLRYRLRRRSDGNTLPTLFDERNVRCVEKDNEPKSVQHAGWTHR